MLSDPVRIGALVTAVSGFLLLEILQRPRGGRPRDRRRRWGLNLAFGAAGFVVARGLAFMGPVAAAAAAQASGFGLLPWLAAPPWAAFIAAFLALDLAVYAQHRAMHENGFLWRLHRAHHTDPTLDVTTAWRFHPAEIAGSLVWKAAVAALIGAPPEAVALYELTLALAALFTHADVRLPSGVDRGLRLLIATPAAHERHHGIAAEDQRSNYGSVLTLWDRLFGSWRAPRPEGVGALGLTGVPAEEAARVRTGLLEPLLQR